MKKTLIFAALLLGLAVAAGCSAADKTVPETLTNTPEPTYTPIIIYQTATPTKIAAATKAATKTPTETPVPVIPVSEEEPTLTWKQLLSEMGAGWNLGNTFDASNCGGADLDYEIAWVDAPVTSPELFDSLKEAGFSSVRIPVTWHNHMRTILNDDGSRAYAINEKWMKRVHEVVDYAYERGFYVIINIHHDDHTNYNIYPDEKHRDSSIEYIKSIWSQIAKEFGDYDEHLIFEIYNEVRLSGANEWIPGSSQGKDAQTIMNTFAQVAVDTIRSTEGKYNVIRFIGVPGYAASIDSLPKFEMPKDPGGYEGRLLYSVHAYIPYNFCSAKSFSFGSSDENQVNDFMKKLQSNFLGKDIPAYIGEWGVSGQDANYSARLKYAAHYLGYAANDFTDAAGEHVYVPCFVWDNTARTKGTDAFGVMNRWNCTPYEPGYLNAIIQASQYKK